MTLFVRRLCVCPSVPDHDVVLLIVSATVYGDPTGTNSSAQIPSSSSPNDSIPLSRNIPIKWIPVYMFISRLLYST